MKQLLLAGLVVICGLAGCIAEEPPEPAEPPPPPPPSAQEIQREILGHLQPLQAFMGEEVDVPEEISSPVISAVSASKSKHQGGENGPAGISQAATQVEDFLNRAYEAKAWALTLVMGQALKTLDPNNTAYDSKLERALVQKNKPKVKVTGFYSDPQTDTTTVFMEIFLPESGQTVKQQAREGEEFYNLRLVKVIGKNNGVELEYLLTGDPMEVMMR